MDLNAVMNDRATAQATYMGETLDLKYRPAMITPATYSKLRSEQSVDELADFLAGAIVSWDLHEPDPNNPGGRRMVEIVPDIFKQMPIHLLRAISRALTEDMPKRDEGKASNDS
jgi:hypothetical protein